MSTYEQALLMYNALSSKGTNFIPLIKKYDLLDGMESDLLIDPYHREI